MPSVVLAVWRLQQAHVVSNPENIACVKNAVCEDRCQNVHSLFGVYRPQLPAWNRIGSGILQHGFPLGPTSSDRHTLGSLLVNVTRTFCSGTMLRASSSVDAGNSMRYSWWGVVLTTHFLLVQGCKWVGAISLPTICACTEWLLPLPCQRWCISVADGIGHDLAFSGDTPLHPTHRNSSHNFVLVTWFWLWSSI